MSPLRELQADVLDALFGRASNAARHVKAQGLPPDRRLGIYRHNMFESLTAALAAVYPTVDALVGRGFFRFAAHAYILAHPSRSGNLHEFGDQFADFLAHFQPAESLPYLADSARLDWAWHAVFHSTAEPGMDAARALVQIAALAEEARLGLRMRWQPAARLVMSGYPILRIWQLHQAAVETEGEPLLDLDAGAECVLVVQRDGEVVLERLSRAEHDLLAALARNEPLGDAVAESLAVDPQFDVASAIAHHLALATLVGLVPPRE